MARADRLERLDAQRADLEAEFRELLVQSLRETAAGRWGLFGHNEHLGAHHKRPAAVAELCAMGELIDSLRERLFMDLLALHQEFLASRGKASAHAVGEPKQAQAWLDRLRLQETST